MRKTIVLPVSGRGRPFLERSRAQEEKDEVLQALDEYRKPRDALLILVSDYVKICAPRLEELGEALPARHTIPELLDSISVNVRISSYLLCVCVRERESGYGISKLTGARAVIVPLGVVRS